MNMDSNQEYPIITSTLLSKSENYSPLLRSKEMIWAKEHLYVIADPCNT